MFCNCPKVCRPCYGWSAPAARRLRFLLDFGLATGLRASELVGATLGDFDTDARGEHWLRVTGKGHKAGRVALPPLAWNALTQYLLARRLPVSPARWRPDTPLVGSLDADDVGAISGMRLWAVLGRFFRQAADLIATDHPLLADKLRRASPHWMRHTPEGAAEVRRVFMSGSFAQKYSYQDKKAYLDRRIYFSIMVD